MHKQAINHKQAIIGGGYLFTENACLYYYYIGMGHWRGNKRYFKLDLTWSYFSALEQTIMNSSSFEELRVFFETKLKNAETLIALRDFNEDDTCANEVQVL